MLKKLDIFLLKSYTGPFVATFFISEFVLLMQFLWKWIDDLVGKGLDFSVIAELMFYALISLIPMALPLAILLASIMTYGNLGEKFELTAIKAAGISLQRAMSPLVIVTFAISIGAFFVANNVIPYANLKMSALIYSIRNQRPELNIKPLIFNNDIENFSIRISRKDPITNTMYDFVVYDHTGGKANSVCMVADSGSMRVTDDNRYMIVKMYSGIQYEDIQEKKQSNYPFRKDVFDEETLVFNLAGFDFNKTDENLFRNNYQVKNVQELNKSTDSLQDIFDRRAEELHTNLTNYYYMKNSSHIEKQYADSLKAHRVHKYKSSASEHDIDISEAERASGQLDTAFFREDSIIRAKIAFNNDSIRNTFYSITPSNLDMVVSLDSLLEAMPEKERQRVLEKTKELANETQTLIVRNAEDFTYRQRTIAKYRNAWHQKFTLSFACMIFFFIGAPLGAIIRKGGFGLPIVVSVLVFLVYYLISTAGMKMAREGLWEPWQGMWLSSFVILPLGVFLTYKATVDAQLFNKEAWMKVFGNIIGFFKKIAMFSDTGDSKENHPLRNSLQTFAFVLGAIGFGFAFSPMRKTALVCGIMAVVLAAVVYILNRKYHYKSKFAILAAIIGIAAITLSLVRSNKNSKQADNAPTSTEQTK